MTPSQTLTLELSEKRQRANELLNKTEELSAEERAELDSLTQRLIEIEPEIRAAIAAEGTQEFDVDPDSRENLELRQMVERASVGEIFMAALEHRQTAGAERELQDHFKLNSNQVPLVMLEQRAVTPAPSDVAQTQQPIIPYVFPQAAAAFLGVDMPRVPTGDVVFPVLTSTLDVGTPAEGADQAETTGAFSAEVLNPARLQASFFYSREDRARFAMMDEALRMNLSDGLADGLDRQILQGSEGLFTGTNLANHNVSAITNYANYVSEFGYSRVDGRYAAMADELRIVVGSGTYAHMGGVYRNNSVDRSALDRLMDITGGVRVSAHVPAVASNKQNGVIRRGMRRDMVAPVWEGVTLIPDEVTKAASGEIVITAVMLHAVKILRADGFYKQQTQHA